MAASGHFRTSEPLTVHAGSAIPYAIGLHFSGAMLMRLFFVLLVFVCAGQTAATAEKSDELAELHQQVVALYRAGKYADATEVARRAVTVAVAKFGPDHPYVGTSLNDLADLYGAQGRHTEAEPLYKRSLSILEKAKGADHPDVGQSLNNLAGLYYAQGRYAEAEPLYKRSLSIRETALGPDHPYVGTSLNNLAGLYESQGRYAEAEPLHKRSLSIRQTALGPDHPDVGGSLNNLAELYGAQGRYAEAEPLHKRSLSIRQTALGPDHPDVGGSLNNLAELYRAQGRYAEAEPLYKRTIAIFERALGADHPHFATSLNNLAVFYQSQGRSAEAEPFFKRSLAIREKALPPDHPYVGQSLNNIAALYKSQERYGEAEPLYKRSLATSEKALGPDHPRVGQSLNNLAGLYRAQGRYGEAEPLYQRTIAIFEKELGADHPYVGQSLNSLAGLYHDQGRYAEAEPLYMRSLSIRETQLGTDHPNVGGSLTNLAKFYKQLGRTDDEARIRARLALMPSAGTRHLPVYFATTRSRLQDTNRSSIDATAGTQLVFGSEPKSQLSFGRVVMQVPLEVIARLGEDRATNLRLDRGREALTTADVFKRIRHRHLGRQPFAASLKALLGRAALSKNQALIFVHGFNVDFDEATKRLSQVAFDLEFDGALVAFSWPSLGSQFRYISDTRRADASVDAFVQFLDQLSEDLPGVRLHVMAHSMGNRILTRALHKIALRMDGATPPNFGEIILAHADATTDWCEKLGKARPIVRGITNYANRDDAALRLSSTIRIGEDRCGLNPRGYDGIETIDTTGMGGERTSLFSAMFGAENHHGVFANDPLLFGDISRLIASGQRPADKRTPEFAKRKDEASGTYWAFDPKRVLGTDTEVATAQ